MKFIHLANWNSTNIGNGALALGTERVLREDLGPETEFVREAWDDYTLGVKTFDESFVNFINTHGDALLINGSVTFNSFRRQMFNTGFRFDLPLPLWSKIKKPIIFYGISYMNWPKQPYPNLKKMIETLKYMIASDNVLFAVRNDGTKQWIEKTFGIVSEKIYEVPDPGLYVPYAKDISYPEIDPAKKNVFIAFNDENNLYRFGGKLREFVWAVLVPFFGDATLERWYKHLPMPKWRRYRFAKKLAYVIHHISTIHKDVQFILMPHYLDDYAMMADYISALRGRITHQMTISGGLLKTSATEYFYGRYMQASLVIAMRIHSMSPTIGMGVPVIPLTYPGRMVRFLRKGGLEDIYVDVFSDFEKPLFEKIDTLLNDPAPLVKRLKEATALFREETRVFNKDILAPFLAR